MKERTVAILFPDGRKFTIIGHNHGERSFPRELKKIVDTAAEEPTNDETSTALAERISELLNTAQVAARHAKEDSEYIREYLESDQDGGFLGVESTDAILQLNRVDLKKLYAKTSGLLQRHGVDPFSREKSLDVALGAIVRLTIEEPGLLRNQSLIGYEDARVEKLFPNAKRNFHKHRAIARELENTDPAAFTQTLKIFEELMDAYPSYNPRRDDRRLLSLAETNAPPSRVKETMALAHATLAYLKSLVARDHANVKNLMDQNSSGLITIGRWHLELLTKILEKRCRMLETVTPNLPPQPVVR